jgi:hypothetical protein
MAVDPVSNPSAYDKIILAGKESPGRAKLNFPTRDEGWEKQESKGEEGGETVPNGPKLIDFEVELYLWKERMRGIDHFARWEAWKPLLLKPVAKGARRALDIYHPQLDGLGITSVVVGTWTEPQPDGKGGGTVKLKFIQYKPSKPKSTKKPSGSVAGPAALGGGDALDRDYNDPNRDKKLELDALNAKDASL